MKPIQLQTSRLTCTLMPAGYIIFLMCFIVIFLTPQTKSSSMQQCELPGFDGAKDKANVLLSRWVWFHLLSLRMHSDTGQSQPPSSAC